MSEFDGPPNNHGAPSVNPTKNKDEQSWLRGRGLALLHSIWTSKKPIGKDGPAGVSQGRALIPLARKNWVVIVVILLLVLPVAGIIIGYFTRLNPATSNSAESSAGVLRGGSPAKPAPGKPMVAAPQAPAASATPQAPLPRSAPNQPSAVMPQSPTAPLNPQTPALAAGATTTVPTVTLAPFSPVVYPARHDKHFGDGCLGQLTLNSNGLVFDCPDDPRGNVQVAISEIATVDENGIRLTSGKKYHFSIAGMTKSGEEQLFANWLSRAR